MNLYEVLKTFRDKFTKKVHEKGSKYPTEDQERANFLQKEGFIKAVEEPQKKPANSRKTKKVADEDEKSS